MDWAMSRPGLQDAAVPLRRRLPRPRRARGHRPAPGGVLRRRRRAQGARPRRRPGRQGALRCRHRGPGRPQEHRPHGRAVHRRIHPGGGGGRPPRPVAHGERGHGRPPRREDGGQPRGRPLPGARASSCSTALCDAAPSWAPDDHLERDDLGPLPRGEREHQAHRAGHPLRAAQPRARASSRPRQRIRPILRLARDRGAHVQFDMEHYDAKDLTLSLFRELLSEDEFADVAAGIVIQAYLRDSRDDLADLIAWSSGAADADHRAAGQGRLLGRRDGAGAGQRLDPAGVRAQGGDRRQLRALRRGCCTTTTARCAPRSARTTCARSPTPSATAGTAACPTTATRCSSSTGWPSPSTPPSSGSVCGCASTARWASWSRGWPTSCAGCWRTPPTRASCATGSPRAAPSTSWSRHPTSTTIPGPTAALRSSTRPTRRARRRTTPSRCASGGGHRRAPRSPSPSSRPVRDDLGIQVPAILAGEQVRTVGHHHLRRPGPDRSGRRHLGVLHGGRRRRRGGGGAGGRAGVARGRRPRSGPGSCSGPPTGCASGATSSPPWSASRRPSRGTRPTATCARRSTSASTTAVRSSAWPSARRDLVQSPPGEANRMTYQGKGVAVVIAPWNFPLAIPCGMTVAALAAGNPVILKPAEQTPGVAWRLAEALARGRRAARRVPAPARARRGRRRSARRAPRRGHHRLHRIEGRRTRDQPHRRRPPARAAPPEEGGVRAGRQERADHRRRRRSRPGRPRRRLLGLRLRRPEVLGGVPAHRPRLACTTPWSSGWSAARRSCSSATPPPPACRSAR